MAKHNLLKTGLVIILFLVLPGLGNLAFAQSADSLEAEIAELEFDGLVIDETITKIGRDFYEIFYNKWSAPGRTTRPVEQDGDMNFATILQIGDDNEAGINIDGDGNFARINQSNTSTDNEAYITIEVTVTEPLSTRTSVMGISLRFSKTGIIIPPSLPKTATTTRASFSKTATIISRVSRKRATICSVRSSRSGIIIRSLCHKGLPGWIP